MNIFYLDKDPQKAAEYQYNKHIVKMILESAQMLCSAHRYKGNNDVPYKSTHINHPSTKWVRENASHYHWLYNHLMALGREYTKRYNKKHLTITKCESVLSLLPPEMEFKPFEQPPQAMPEVYKEDCSVEAYWNYYLLGKTHIANKNETIKTERPSRLEN
tara:strand:- start:3038 stop:3517 length:480 start_codon:yes stop_codon:yes gene_type:complete